MYIRTYAYKYILVFMNYAYIHISQHAMICIYVYNVCISTCIHIYFDICICIHIDFYTYICIYIFIHAFLLCIHICILYMSI